MSGAEEGEDESHMEFYNTLNVPRDATAEQIKASYRRLCQTYHPDKHTDEELKAAATENFTRLKDAYEVLFDPLKRKVYDEYGLEGLRTLHAEGMEMSVWEDVKSRFEQKGAGGKSNTNAQERDSVLSVHNSVKATVDASGLVSALEDFDPRLGENRFILTQLMLASNLTAYVSNTDTLSASYTIVTRGLGRSAGTNFSISGRRAFNADTFAEVALVYGVSGRKSNSNVTAKLWRKLTERSTAMLEATYSVNEDVMNMVFSAVRQLSDRWTSQLAWITGAQNGVLWTIRHSPAHEGGGLVDEPKSDEEHARLGLFDRIKSTLSTIVFNTDVKLGTFDTSISASVQKGLGSSWQDGGFSGGFSKLRGKVGIGFWDLELSGGRNIIPWNASFAVGVSLGTDGVALKVKMARSGHKLTVPVVISSETRPVVASITASLAILLAALVQYHIVRPIKKAQIQEAKEEARMIRKTAMEKARSDAEAALELMQVALQRSREGEEAMEEGGLIIVRAFYGSKSAVRNATQDMESVAGKEIELELVDVTDAIQYMVEDSKVLVYSTSKSSLMGFWDPTALEDDERALGIWYKFRKAQHYCLVGNFEALEIPLRAHRLGN